MIWTCEKCNKQIEISTEQLSETQGVVVCPQCLATATVPGYRRKATKKIAQAVSAQPEPRPASQAMPQSAPTPTPKPKTSATPPPYRKKQPTVNSSSPRFTPVPERATSRYNAPAPSKPKPKRKKKKKQSAHVTGWGCLWQSALITIVLLALYLAIGYLLQGV